jgi:hypothetical protein
MKLTREEQFDICIKLINNLWGIEKYKIVRDGTRRIDITNPSFYGLEVFFRPDEFFNIAQACGLSGFVSIKNGLPLLVIQ